MLHGQYPERGLSDSGGRDRHCAPVVASVDDMQKLTLVSTSCALLCIIVRSDNKVTSTRRCVRESFEDVHGISHCAYIFSNFTRKPEEQQSDGC